LLCCLLLFLSQEKFIFKAHSIPEDAVYTGAKEIEITVENDLSLNAAIVEASPGRKSDKPREYTLLLLI